MIAKEVAKNRTTNIAGQMFIEYGKELDKPHRKIKKNENYIGDDRLKNEKLSRIIQKTEIQSENCKGIYKNKSLKKLKKNLNNNKRE